VPSSSRKLNAALQGTRLLSLALNLPGPAALQRLRAMGARCTQVLPPSGDPMAQYSPQAQQQLGLGIWQTTLDLKSWISKCESILRGEGGMEDDDAPVSDLAISVIEAAKASAAAAVAKKPRKSRARGEA